MEDELQAEEDRRAILCEHDHTLTHSKTWPEEYPIRAVILCDMCVECEIGREGSISTSFFYHCTTCAQDICASCAVICKKTGTPVVSRETSLLLERADSLGSTSDEINEDANKILIIHPDDRTTDTLCLVYENIPEDKKTVIRGGIDTFEVERLIATHERVLLCGHGYPGGLLGIGKFDTADLCIVSSRHVPLLKENSKNIYIWCYASSFVRQYGLKGFASGMFISEVDEAVWCGITDPVPTKEQVDLSFDTFCRILAKYLMFDLSPEDLYNAVHSEYSILAEKCPVAKYNLDLLEHF